jgi:ABC-type Fe3+ transport system permease subunit
VKLSRLLAVATALLVVSPLVGLLVGLIDPPPDPFGMPPASLAALMAQSRAVELLRNSLILSVAVSAAAVLAGDGSRPCR